MSKYIKIYYFKDRLIHRFNKRKQHISLTDVNTVFVIESIAETFIHFIYNYYLSGSI
jgi:hypothetical protein